VVPDKSGGIIVVTSAANRSASVDERRLWVAQATGATISRAVVAQQSADTLEGAGDMVLAANRSAIGKFVDGLVASPPICELVPVPPGVVVVVVVVGGIPFVIPQPPSPPPEWKSGEQLSGIDLLNVAIRFRVAATALDAGPLREEFLAAESRLFEVGAERL
jgi:nitroreductase